MENNMSVEINDPDLLTIVWLANQSDKNKPEIKFTNEFTNLDEFKNFIINKTNASIIVVISDSISLDSLSPNNLPQICAVYNDKLICLYCLPSMVSLVVNYMKKYQEEQLKEPPKQSNIVPFIRKYWFLMGLVIVIILAYLFPNVGKTGGYIRSEWSVKWGCVILIFFLSGLSLRTKQLAKEFLRVRVHAFVQIYSLLIIPFTIYGFGLLLTKTSINTTLIIGIIIMASTSTTISSNVVMTKNAMGNEYVALLNAVLGNLLGIFVSPALIFYFVKNPIFNTLSDTNNTNGQLDYTNVIKNLSITVLVPLFIGQIIHLLWTKQVMYVREKFYFTELNSLALLTLVWAVFCTAFANGSFNRIETNHLLILIVIDAVIYVGFSLLIMITARLPIRYWQYSVTDTVAMMFCGATKTLAMGIPLINALYGNKDENMVGVLSLPLIMYHAEQLILGAFEVILLKKWVNRRLKKEASLQKDKDNIQTRNENKVEPEEVENMNAKC